MDGWVAGEVAGCDFPDQRLKARLGTLLGELSEKIGAPIPAACQDWAATKAAYRFFDNDRIDESSILAGHFAATSARFAATTGPILVLHDTTEFSFKRERPELIGQTCAIPAGLGGAPSRTLCGILMHSSLVVTPTGVPLGIAAVKFWTRQKFKGTNALKRTVNPTRVPIEQKESVRWLENLRGATTLLADPGRCVHVADRESDIFELFCMARQIGTHFVVRTCVDRLCGTGDTTIDKEMDEQPVKGNYEIEVRNRRGEPSMATLELKFCRMQILPPIGKNKSYPAQTLTVIRARERSAPEDREPIDWKLLTDLEVNDAAAAIEKLNWYASRWKIETFHKVLKSGCGAEKSKLRTAARLTNQLAIYCIVAWRVFWLTMVQRATPDAPASAVLTDEEIEILRSMRGARRTPKTPTVSECVVLLAKLGGYLARRNDPPPGNTVIWRGLSRLTDIHLGFELRKEVVGN